MNLLNLFLSAYHEVLYRPLFNGLIWLYGILPWQDLGISIILFTIIVRFILAPLMIQGQTAQKKMAALQPQIKKLQEQFKNDREAQSKALMELYAQNNINPFSGCLTLLIQLPILFAIFGVFRHVADPEQLKILYSFVHNPGSINPIAFGYFNLTKGSIYLGVPAALTQFLQTRMTLPQAPASGGENDMARIMTWQLQYFLPIIILITSASLPSALAIYWTVFNVFGIVQELIMRKMGKKI